MNQQPLSRALDDLKHAFSTILELPADADFDQLEYGVTAGWDSVAHMALVAEIETAFDIMLTTDELIGLSSFRAAREILGQQGIGLDE